MKSYKGYILRFLLIFIPLSPFAQVSKTLNVTTQNLIAPIQPTMWGVFFEDINFGADGGVYAELVKNRSFEFYQSMMGWEVINEGGNGSWSIIKRGELMNTNPSFIRLQRSSPEGSIGLRNEGFRGMGIREEASYRFSVLARQLNDEDLKLNIVLTNSQGEEIGRTQLSGFSSNWEKKEVVFTAKARAPKAALSLFLEGEGSLDLDMISLFPVDTWKGRKNGLRKDIVQMIADLKPGFIRFPGGCVVEGRELDMRYQWKKTVGPIEERRQIVNRWNTEFSYRPAPDYFQSFGLGFYEYFLLAEDLGSEPLPILNCGMACQFNTGELVPLDELDPFIQDALDLIEFANGSVETSWGSLRAEMGHPEPFNMKFLGVGNEQWGEQYVERYKAFEKVLKAEHPEITLIAGSGPYNRGEWFDELWTAFSELGVDMMDEHYYAPPKWFLSNATRYDDYDREGPIVFAGEFAAHGPSNEEPTSRNHWWSALTEAAYMTGLERNADLVHLASYAPLLAHVEAWQWRPDLIWFDNLEVMGTPNYYVQKLYSTNKGTHAVPVLSEGEALTGQDSLYASAVIDENTNEVILKIVNTSKEKADFNIQLDVSIASTGLKRTTLTAEELLDYNTLEKPKKVFPKENQLNVSGKDFQLSLGGHTFIVLRGKLE